MGAEREALPDILAGLRDEYASALSAKLARIESLWREVAAGVDSLKGDLLHAAHMIAGAAATFGRPDVGAAALDLELALRPICEREGAPRAEERFRLDQRVARLLDVAAHRGVPGP